MEENKEAIDKFVLGLLYLTSFKDSPKTYRAWKGMDWNVLDRLFEAGYIYDPKGKAKSIAFTDEGFAKSKEIFEELFTKQN